MAKPQSSAERFSTYVTKTDTCWLWQGARDEKGYGYSSLNGRNMRAHRVSWTLAHGEIPDGLLVLHHCDVPPCVNPAHLFLGTNADNMADMKAKNRQARGDRSGSRRHPESRPRGSRQADAKLNEAQAKEIRSIEGLSQRAIARRYGVSNVTIHKLRTRKTWKHVL